jgi:hypothetical protein
MAISFERFERIVVVRASFYSQVGRLSMIGKALPGECPATATLLG